ncbi:putative Ig domain-containing protein [Spirosoma pollinicola]|uniref:Cyclic nucleotide-binding domain-containing protein n=1 Tax=Spirosoma pollinicola TaxID=2057025 RepID=A0A2K8YS30_9BACT|nr:putative Ig domain-containing protein [Spirosoma pollinicola]AUD00425.1 hypothetical protein CWM47_00470 [Spirosoma pollinicola]
MHLTSTLTLSPGLLPKSKAMTLPVVPTYPLTHSDIRPATGISVAACRQITLRDSLRRLLLVITLVFMSIAVLTGSMQAQTITGTVFRDFNSDGAKDNTANFVEPGVGGVTVTAYNAAGASVGTTTTSSAAATLGQYTLTTGAGQFRVEFTSLPASNYDSFKGTGSGTSVQFVSGGSTSVNLGIGNAANYCQPNPIIADPCYLNGSRASNGTESVVVLFNDLDRGQGKAHQNIAKFSEIGAVWGQAYNRDTKKLYLSAFIKRHMDLGPNGLGAIYEIDLTTPTTAGAGTPTLWLDINASTFVDQANAPVNLGFPADPGASSRGLGVKTSPSRDNWGWANMGREGIGDIELSEDGKRLYVTDLSNQQVLCIDYTTKKLLWKLAVTTPTCLGGSGDIRPWALKEHNGVLYVGAVCSGETNQNDAQLHYYIMKCNSLTAATSMSLAVNLGNSLTKQASKTWNAWYPAIAPASVKGMSDGSYHIYPQPIISDIEFDINDNMLIGVMDRSGHQTGFKNFIPNVTNSNLINGIAYGDITYAKAPAYTTVETAPWSFFDLTASINNPPLDQFTGGMVTTNLSQNFVAANMIDPFDFNSNGITWDKTSDGQQQGGTDAAGRLEIVPNASDVSTFGKGSGLGDLAMLCDNPPIMIGNRVWNDANDNGVQDPGESPLAGVTVTLKGPASTTVATVTTNPNGEYYFTDATGTNTTGFAYGLSTLTAGVSYSLCFPTSFSTLSLSTKPNSASGSNTEAIDSDPNAAGVIVFTLGNAGQNNFNYDAGYTVAACDLTATATPGTCNSATNQYSVSGTISLTSAVAGTATITDGAKSTTVAVVASATSVAYTLAGLTSGSGSHTVVVTLPGCGTDVTTYTAPASCSVAPCALNVAVTPGICNSATNQYSISGTVSLTNAVAGTLTITDGTATTTITVSATDTNIPYSLSGFTSTGASHTVVATLPGCGSDFTTYTAPASCTVCTVNLTTSTLPNGQVGTAYSQTLTTTGGTTPYTYAVSTGTLPTGLTLNPTTGVISGTPTAATTSVFTIKVTDAKSCTDVASLTIVTSSAPACSQNLVVTPGTCNSATNQYSISGTVSFTNAVAGTLTITDGSKSTTVAVTAGATSVAYSLTGLTSGSGSHTVTSSLTNCGTDFITYAAPASCTVCTVNLVTSTLPDGQVGTAYSRTLVTSGGTTPYTYAVSIGTLPSGLSLNPTTGVISGIPSAAATSAFSIKVTDAKSCTDVTSLTITTSALPVCSLDLIVTPGTCNSVTNQYSISGTVGLTNSTAGNLVITDGAKSTTLTITASTTSVVYSLTGLTSGSGSHTVIASLSGCGTDNAAYSAPASCTVAPPAIAVVVGIPTCNSLTNNYTATGTVSLTNAVAGTLTITDNGASLTTITVTAGQATASFSVSGVSNAGSHTVVATLTGGPSATTTYTAPASCTVCSLSLTTASLPNGQVGTPYSQMLTTTGGTAPLTYTISVGSLPTGLTLNPTTGLIAGIPTAAGSFTATLRVTDSKGCQVSLPLTVFDINTGPVCSIGLAVTPGVCSSATNTYTLSGMVSLSNNTTGGTILITSGLMTTTLTVSNTATLVPFSLTGLGSDGLVHTVTATLSGCSTSTTTYTAPASCTQPVSTKLTLDKMVNLSKAKLGDILTYTLVLTNTGTTIASNIVVTDSSTVGLNYVAGSATAPVGTTFTQGSPISTWQVASISAGQSLMLTFQAKADSSGILYNKATIPGDTAIVCTSIPVVMCVGDIYTFQLSVPAGRSSYKWFRDNVEIVGQTTNSLDITGPGTYSLAVDNTTGKCPDFSCCPFIIEEDSLPAFKATAIPVTCVGKVLQANGKIELSSFDLSNTYQYSAGSVFNPAASLSGTAKSIPTGGVLVSNLTNPLISESYTVRVYNRSGCFKDVTVTLLTTVCDCLPDVCVPFVLKQTKRAKRIGDVR